MTTMLPASLFLCRQADYNNAMKIETPTPSTEGAIWARIVQSESGGGERFRFAQGDGAAAHDDRSSAVGAQGDWKHQSLDRMTSASGCQKLP